MFRLLLLGGRMPAYNSSFVFAVFFILYILINTYIFMSVFLAVVYNNYKKYLKVRRVSSRSATPHRLCHFNSCLRKNIWLLVLWPPFKMTQTQSH